MRVRFPLPAPACLRLAAQDSRLSSGTTRVQIPQAGPNPPSLKLRRANRQPVEARSAKIGFVPLRLTAGCRTLNAAIVVRIHEGEPTRNAGVAQRQSGALIRRRSVVQISPPAPAFAASRLRLASHSVAKIARRSFSEGGLQNIPAVVQRSERLNVDQVTHVRFVPQGPAGRLMKGCPPKLQRRRANSSDVPFPRGCSSAAERRSPKPRQRGFDPCLPRQSLDVHGVPRLRNTDSNY